MLCPGDVADILHVRDRVQVVVPRSECIDRLAADLESARRCPAELNDQPVFEAKVASMFQDLDVVAVALSTAQESAVQVIPGQTVLLERPTDDGLWIFAASVRSKHGIRLEISWPQKSCKVERREFCRVRLDRPTRCAHAEDPECFLSAVLQDVSGGGACLVAPPEIQVGQTLTVEVPLDNEVVTIKGVVRNLHSDNGTEHVIGLEFVDIAMADQDKIISFVFNRQLKLRREKLSS